MMHKLKKIIEFILALLSFLFTFKHKEDDVPAVVATFPKALPPHPQARDEPVFEAVR